MIKGCQRRVIVVKDTNNPKIQEAYIVLKDPDGSDFSRSDMIEEAQKILCDGDNGFSARKRRRREGLLLFLAGMALSALLSLAAYLLLSP